MGALKKKNKENSASLVRWTLASILTGIATGIFLGEYCRFLKPVGDAFVGLLRMTVLPFIIVSLIANFGRLSIRQSRRLLTTGAGILVGLWLIALAAIPLLAQTFPSWKRGSFFSVASTESVDSSSLLDVFIPANVFESLAKNHVPAIVLISIWSGIVLSGTKNRKLLIKQLDVCSRVLMRISRSIARYTPIGVFAIAASTAGLISFDEFGRLQAYLLIYTVGAVAIGFLLPLIVSAFTPFTYRDVMKVAGESMLMAFATGKLIIVIPKLVEETEKLFAKHATGDRKTTPSVDVLYPLAYPFPHVGKLLSMLFIPFVAWFLGNALELSEYPLFLSAGVFSYFGGPLLAMPFLLDLMRLPHDMFQLFLLTGLWEGRLGDALGVMHLVVFTLLTTCAFTKRIDFTVLRFVKFLLGCVVAATSVLAGLSVLTNELVPTGFHRADVLSRMQLLTQPSDHIVRPTPTPNPDPLLPGETLLERIRRRGRIRIGYNEDKLPFAFLNLRGELVGFDVEMAHTLAADLNVKVEFTRFSRDTLALQLEEDHFDVVMSGLIGTLERSATMLHTAPYMDVTLGLVVPDYRVRKFRTIELLRKEDGLRIGFVDLSRGFVERLVAELPDADLVRLSSIQQFFEGRVALDALLVSAESGSAYTLLYPGYEVVLPLERGVTLPLFYAVGGRDQEFKEYLEHWIEVKKRDGTTDEFYNHWVLGKTRADNAPRWSVIRNVLHWVD